MCPEEVGGLTVFCLLDVWGGWTVLMGWVCGMCLFRWVMWLDFACSDGQVDGLCEFRHVGWVTCDFISDIGQLQEIFLKTYPISMNNLSSYLLGFCYFLQSHNYLLLCFCSHLLK